MKKFLATILSVILLLTIIPMAYAEESNTYKVGDIIQFGSYPQSEVKDEALIAELNALAPEWDEWTSYGYYSGSLTDFGFADENSATIGDWMKYTDIKYEGEKYRGVKFTQYRPYRTFAPSSSLYTFQSNNGYGIDTIYWFKFEPIEWRLLDIETGLVMCETIIDSQPYCNICYTDPDIDPNLFIYEHFNDASCTNYANDYETSYIRAWLNNDFYNTAFTNGEKNKISKSTLNNDSYYTSIGVTGYEAFDGNTTNDKIFLLSYNEAVNSSFGFSSDNSESDPAKIAQGSDYAKSQGLWVSSGANAGCSSWLLRTSGYESDICCWIFYKGYSYNEKNSGGGCAVNDTSRGIRPALKLAELPDMNKPEHQHLYNSTTTKPTCTTQGYTTYVCACGDSYVADYVNALGHKDNNGDYKCDNGCSYEFEKPAPENPDTPEEPSKDCSCNCHKGGISGFFWKIINFFNKLFKSKQYCGCGAKHW